MSATQQEFSIVINGTKSRRHRPTNARTAEHAAPATSAAVTTSLKPERDPWRTILIVCSALGFLFLGTCLLIGLR